MKKIAVLTGAGMSAESGLKTFRDAGGLWEGHDVTQVASPEGWQADRNMVLNFYNERRKQALSAKPNEGHIALADLESDFRVSIITQNVDDLHERAGSTRIIHLHGELFKSRSTVDPSLIYDIEGWELNEGDLCEKGSQLRPHIVWFGEMVPEMERAIEEISDANIVMIVGTSLTVYPAASLIQFAPSGIPIYLIDPNLPEFTQSENLIKIPEPATRGVIKAVRHLKENIA